MSVHRPVRRSVGARALGVLVAAVLVFGASACSSDSSSDADSANVEPGSATPKSDGGSKGDRPDGFPDDVPLPEFEKINVLMRGTDDTPDIWSVMLTIDPTLSETGDDLMDAYRGQLEDAGYVVEEAGAGVFEAENDEWSINFHSSMDGTLTIGTVSN